MGLSKNVGFTTDLHLQYMYVYVTSLGTWFLITIG